MGIRALLLLSLISIAPGLKAQAEDINVEVDKAGERGNMGVFTFSPDGEIQQYAKSGPAENTQTLHDFDYLDEALGGKLETWTFVSGDAQSMSHLRKQTSTKDGKLEQWTTRANDRVIREAVYLLDTDGRPVRLTLMKEEVEGESRRYETVQYEYTWVGPAEVEIRSGNSDEVFYRLKKTKQNLIVDKKKKRRTLARTTYRYNREGRLSAITKTETVNESAKLLQISYRKNGFLRGAISSPYTTKIDVKAGRYLWNIRKADELTALPESVSGRIAESILEELVLKDRVYRLFFPRELNLF